jgi:hypothetical protein
MRSRTMRALRPMVVLVAAGCALVGGLAACSTEPEVPTAEIGDCIDDESLGILGVDEIDTVDCGEPHDNEVYAKVQLEGDDYPGDSEVSEQAQSGCEEEFEAFVGLPFAESQYFFTTITPTEESWDEADDREVLCVIFGDEPVSGSLEGVEE